MSKYIGRLAPTPSGFLHVGHLQTFKEACLRAKLAGGKIILRIEDIDSSRTRKEYIDAAVKDMRSFGISWDEGYGVSSDSSKYLQSNRILLYKDALSKLAKKGVIYKSFVSRKELSSFPSKIAKPFDFLEGEKIFPSQLRGNVESLTLSESDFFANWRFQVPDGKTISFEDKNFGKVSLVAGKDFGDFAVWRKNGEPMYELAVCVDDADMKITEVVRGADLLVSTARQILLYEALELKVPDFFHCPLVLDDNGKKLSKSVLKKNSPHLLKNR